MLIWYRFLFVSKIVCFNKARFVFEVYSEPPGSLLLMSTLLRKI